MDMQKLYDKKAGKGGYTTNGCLPWGKQPSEIVLLSAYCTSHQTRVESLSGPPSRETPPA